MRPPTPLVLTALGILASACSGTTSTAPPTPNGVVQAELTPTAVPVSKGPFTVKLLRFPAGLALVGLDATVHELTVEIKVGGLAPGSTHAARLVASSCAHPGAGPVLHGLDPVVVAANAIAETRTVVKGISETGIPATGWSLIVDRGAAAGGVPTMCGDLDNQVGQTVITVPMGVAPVPGGADPRAAGTVTLSITGGALRVVFDVSGLTPRSTHDAALRKGNCEGEGAVLHPLTPLTADAAGHATATTDIPGIAAIPLDGWFVGVSPTGVLDPVLCANV